MNNSDFNQGVSIRVFMHDHLRSDGTRTIYLRVIIDRQKKEFNLKVYWPLDFWDDHRQEAMSRHVKDKEAESVNMVINEAKGRASRIKLRYFSESRLLTHALFKAEFENYESKDNFLFYWISKQNALYKNGVIGKSTMIRHNTNLERFKAFLGCPNFFSMSALNNGLLLQYQNWLRKKKKLKHNTAVNALKTIKAYLNHAVADGFKITDPFTGIPLRYQPGERQALDRHELKRLRDVLDSEKLQAQEKEVLRKFLFSCYTGIRISDSAQVTMGMIRDGALTVSMIKGRRYGKVVRIPLPNYARDLVEGRIGTLFDAIADQTCNEWLKVLAFKADIHKRLTFHVSRDTFATIFIELGGDVFSLKEILGHGNIQTTQIYVKMSEKRVENMMRNFDSL